jgi:hypothetical protein
MVLLRHIMFSQGVLTQKLQTYPITWERWRTKNLADLNSRRSEDGYYTETQFPLHSTNTMFSNFTFWRANNHSVQDDDKEMESIENVNNVY